MPPVAWKLTVRVGPKVEKSRYDALEDALDALEERARALADESDARTVDLKVRQFEPADQVVARLELAGPERLVPKVRAGIDVHGDGTVESYLGHIKREELAEGKGEKPYRALRRAVARQVSA